MPDQTSKPLSKMFFNRLNIKKFIFIREVCVASSGKILYRECAGRHGKVLHRCEFPASSRISEAVGNAGGHNALYQEDLYTNTINTIVTASLWICFFSSTNQYLGLIVAKEQRRYESVDRIEQLIHRRFLLALFTNTRGLFHRLFPEPSWPFSAGTRSGIHSTFQVIRSNA